MVDQNDIAADKYLKTDTITFEELPYIQKYQNLLRLPDKETSLKLFTKQEPEPQQIVILKTRHAENAGKIEKGLQRLKSLEGAIAAKQFQAEQDTAWLDRANMFKTRLLAILPPVFRKEGEIFLNRFIMENLKIIRRFPFRELPADLFPALIICRERILRNKVFPSKSRRCFTSSNCKNSAMNLTRQTMSTGNTTPALTLPARQKR